MTAEACPRCGTWPVEVSELGQAEPDYLPACSCYPHPPLCPSCRQPLTDGRCEDPTGRCPTPHVLVPVPIVDPLWERQP